MSHLRLALVLSLVAPGAQAAADKPTVVIFCAPGYPGSTKEAQGPMDALAASLQASGAGPIAATYYEDEAAGQARLAEADAAVALVTLPFFLAHEKALGLTARLQALPKGRAALERWTLVAKKGVVKNAVALEGYAIHSLAGFAPDFVRHVAEGALGPLPASVKIVRSSAVLSALRKVAAGEPIAVLLDGEQAAAVSALPFAGEIETVASSAEVPTGIVATVRGRPSAARWKALAAALTRLGESTAGTAALEGIRMTGFVPLDDKALTRARALYAGARP